jgi:hypothetical protein
MPVSVLLKHKDGVYSIDSFDEDGDPEKNILTWMVTFHFNSYDENNVFFSGSLIRKVLHQVS